MDTTDLDDINTFRKGMGSKNEFNDTDIIRLVFICSVCAVAIIILVFACSCYVNHCRNSSKIHRRRNRSETCELYQNYETIRERLADVAPEKRVSRPLPKPTEGKRQSTGVPAVNEDDYVAPITVDAMWRRSRQEIEKLPPAPPVFPVHLERLQLEGEGAYTQVIPEDQAPLPSPGPSHEITHNLQLCESREKYGYLVPRSPDHTSLQQNVTETDHSKKMRRIKRKGNEYQMRASAVVTSHEAEKQCRNTSKRRPLSEGATVNSAAQSETKIRRIKKTRYNSVRVSCTGHHLHNPEVRKLLPAQQL